MQQALFRLIESLHCLVHDNYTSVHVLRVHVVPAAWHALLRNRANLHASTFHRRRATTTAVQGKDTSRKHDEDKAKSQANFGFEKMLHLCVQASHEFSVHPHQLFLSCLDGNITTKKILSIRWAISLDQYTSAAHWCCVWAAFPLKTSNP
eukprot:3932119-Rhodomonas_salina.2